MANSTPPKAKYDYDLATNDVCRTMASWIVVASSNKTQAHQFRLQSSLTLIGFGAVSSSIFIENGGIGGLFIGVFVLMAMIAIALLLDSYYFKDEYAWDAACTKIDSTAIRIAIIGLKAYGSDGGKIKKPHHIYKTYINQNDRISRHDFTTKMLRAVGFVVAISIGIFSGIKLYESMQTATKSATETEQKQSLQQTPPKTQEWRQTLSKP